MTDNARLIEEARLLLGDKKSYPTSVIRGAYECMTDLANALEASQRQLDDHELAAIQSAVGAAATDMWDEHIEPLQQRLAEAIRLLKLPSLWTSDERTKREIKDFLARQEDKA